MSFLSLKSCSGFHFPQSKHQSLSNSFKNIHDQTIPHFFDLNSYHSLPPPPPTHVVLDTLASSWSLQHTRRAPTLGLLHWLFPLPWNAFSPDIHVANSIIHISAQVTSLVKPTLTILLKIATQLVLPNPPYPVLLFVSIVLITF